jgi:hypothetical protein
MQLSVKDGNLLPRSASTSPKFDPVATVCAIPARARGMPNNSTATCIAFRLDTNYWYNHPQFMMIDGQVERGNLQLLRQSIRNRQVAKKSDNQLPSFASLALLAVSY